MGEPVAPDMPDQALTATHMEYTRPITRDATRQEARRLVYGNKAGTTLLVLHAHDAKPNGTELRQTSSYASTSNPQRNKDMLSCVATRTAM